MHSSSIMWWTVLKTVFSGCCGGAVFKCTAADYTKECFVQVGGRRFLHVYSGGLYGRLFYTDWWGKQSSGELQWTVLKTVFTGWWCGAAFNYTAVDCNEMC